MCMVSSITAVKHDLSVKLILRTCVMCIRRRPRCTPATIGRQGLRLAWSGTGNLNKWQGLLLALLVTLSLSPGRCGSGTRASWTLPKAGDFVVITHDVLLQRHTVLVEIVRFAISKVRFVISKNRFDISKNIFAVSKNIFAILKK